MPHQETGSAVVPVPLQRRVGLRARLLAACIGIGSPGAGGKGAFVARRSPIPKIEEALPATGSSVPSWLLVLWAARNRKDLPRVGIGRALWIINLHDQPGGF